MEKFKSTPGVFDVIPLESKEVWKESRLWCYLEEVIRQIAADFGFSEIRTPLFERTELFTRGVGESSDIVSKEMYTFKDKAERSLTLRPEGTASVMRAFLEHSLAQKAPLHKFFYIGPMFRYERSQAGRYRQHHQFGVEVIGGKEPEYDVEVIDLLYSLYQRLGLKNLTVCINSIGCKEARGAYKSALKDFLKNRFHDLSLESQHRFEANPLRILDSKDPKDQEILQGAPSILDFLSEGSLRHFERVKTLLSVLKIPFVVQQKLVRGLDYYNETVFEIVSKDLGAQNSIGGGGRYDGLLKTLGGPDLPAIGFGTGLERVLQALCKQEKAPPFEGLVKLFLIPLGEEAKGVCFSLTHQLRFCKIATQMDFSSKKLSRVMHYAHQIGAEYVVVIGEEEIKEGMVQLKNMKSGLEVKVALNKLVHLFEVELAGVKYKEIWEKVVAPFDNPQEVEFFKKEIVQEIENTKKIAEKLQGALLEIKKHF